MLDPAVIEELKEKLLEEKARLERDLGKIAKKENGDYEAKYPEDLGRDQDENAEEVEEYATQISITENLEKRLKEVEDALARIEKGTYGICENCQEKEIPLERLRANPAARTCLDCS
jgi:DnaK suppressor protein